MHTTKLVATYFLMYSGKIRIEWKSVGRPHTHTHTSFCLVRIYFRRAIRSKNRIKSNRNECGIIVRTRNKSDRTSQKKIEATYCSISRAKKLPSHRKTNKSFGITEQFEFSINHGYYDAAIDSCTIVIRCRVSIDIRYLSSFSKQNQSSRVD